MATPTPAPNKRNRALIVNYCGLYWPSAMVRALQYRPLFEKCATWEAEYTSRHSESLVNLERDRRPPVRVLVRALRVPFRAYATRWNRRREDEIVERATDFDVVSIIKSPGTQLYRRLCRLGRPRVIMDISDAVWLPAFGWVDLDALLAEVHGVTCENEYVAAYARRYNARVWVVPDAPQIEVFDRFRSESRPDPDRITLGWIGGSENIGHLYRILEVLETLFARYPKLHLRVVGADESKLPKFENVRYSCLAHYTQEEMVREVLGFDIGLFPLFHNEDARARGTLKAMVYMSGEAVAVCENYGENPGLIRDGWNGVLASSDEEWHDKLERLIRHPAERTALAQRGLQTIRERFTAELVFQTLIGAYEQIVSGYAAKIVQ